MTDSTVKGVGPSIRSHMYAARQHQDSAFLDLLRFDDTTVVITGGAQGIGRAVARRFSELGAAVVLLDIDPRIESVAAELSGASGRPVRAVRADVRDSAQLAQVATAAAKGTEEVEPGRLVWVNAAGIYPSHLIADLGDDEWDQVVGLDLTGTYYGSRAAALAARERGIGGVIINVSSIAGFRVGRPPGIAHYAAAKHGVQGLTKALAAELGPEGIRVNCLAPGAVITEGLVARFGEMDLEGGTDYFSQRAQEMPLRRPSLPDDVARAACFLASHAASNLTGVVLPVDAGQLVL